MLTDSKFVASRNSSKKWKNWKTDAVKIDAVKLYLLTGNQAATAAALGLHHKTMQNWCASQWFKDLTEQLKRENNVKLSSKLRNIADKALEETADRLQNGDYFYDQKTGELVRKPIPGRETAKIAVQFVESATKLENKVQTDQDEQATMGRLEKLAEAFAQFANKTTKVEVIDIEPIKVIDHAVHD